MPCALPKAPKWPACPGRRTTNACLPFQGGEQAWLRSGGAAASQLLLRRGKLSLPVTLPVSGGGTGQRTQSLTPVSTSLFPSENQPHGTCLTGPQTRPRHTPTDNARSGGMDGRAEGPWIPPCVSSVWLPASHLQGLCPEVTGGPRSSQSFGSQQHLKAPPRDTPCGLSAPCRVWACRGQGH